MIGVLGPSDLVAATMGRTEGPTILRIGTLTQVLTNEVVVSVAGGSIHAGYLAAYTPTVGHVVALLQTQEAWIVLGRVIGPKT